MKDVNSRVFPPTQVEKKKFPKKRFQKKIQTFFKHTQKQYPHQDTPTNKPDTGQFSIKEPWGFTLQDLDGTSLWYTQALQTMPPSYAKVHSHEPMDFNIAKCRKTWFWGKQIQQTRAAPKLCHTEGLHPMANTNGIATSASPGLQKLGILCLEQPNSWKETTSQTSNLATTAFWWTTIAKFLWDTQGTGMQNTVPTPFWQPEMTQNAEICKKIALLWTGLPFNTGFMTPLKSPPSSWKM